MTKYILKECHDPQQLGTIPSLSLSEPTPATGHGVPVSAAGLVVKALCKWGDTGSGAAQRTGRQGGSEACSHLDFQSRAVTWSWGTSNPLEGSAVGRGRLPRLAIFLPNFVLGLTSVSVTEAGNADKWEEEEKLQEGPHLVLLLWIHSWKWNYSQTAPEESCLNYQDYSENR